MAGKKDDTGKPEFDRLSFEAISVMNAVHKFGDSKYEEGNWKEGLHIRRLLNASLRHIFQTISGNFMDSESGLPHVAHAAVNLEMVLHYLIYHDKYAKFIDIKDKNSTLEE